MSGDENSSSFTIGNGAQEKGLPYVQQCYIVSPSNRSSLDTVKAQVPTIDMAGLRQNDSERSVTIKVLGNACRRGGFFQVVNHGICQSILDEALSMAFGFFNLPTQEEVKFKSNDVYKPVRYETSLKDEMDKVQFWRVFLKHYAHPLDAWIDSWLDNPSDYREKMGKYCAEVRKLALELMGIGTNGSAGLEILDTVDGNWKVVPELHGALQVHVGDHFEVLSNGLYKSVVHRATLNCERTRISIASLHSLGMDDKMEIAKELVDEQHPKRYKESSFRDFLDFLATNDIADGKSFIDTLKT